MNFNSEWRTIQEHRVFLSCRDGFPRESYWEMAKEIVNEIKPFPDARLVEIFVEERHGNCTYRVATDNYDSIDALKMVLKEGYIRKDGSTAQVIPVKPYPYKNYDSYNHMKYLSENA